jgi:hypothetical protein
MRKVVRTGSIVMACVFMVSTRPAVAATLPTPPSAYHAHGQYVAPEAPDQIVPFDLWVENQHARLEVTLPAVGKTAVLATRGEKLMTFLDTVQKMAYEAPPEAMGAPEGMPPLSDFLSPVTWRKSLLRGARLVAHREVVARQNCTVHERLVSGVPVRAWIADRIGLPLQLTSMPRGRPGFRFTVQGFEIGDQPDSQFEVPSSYTRQSLETP